MFKITIDCPNGSHENQQLCEGYKNPESGALKNDCAVCQAYRNYVAQTSTLNVTA